MFKDANLKRLILEKYPAIDLNGDGNISALEAEKVTTLDLLSKIRAQLLLLR